MSSNKSSKISTIMQQSTTTPSSRVYSSSGNRRKIRNSAAKSQQLRNRYLRMLGIRNSSTDTTDATISRPNQMSRMKKVKILKEPLKGNDGKYVKESQSTTHRWNSPQSVMYPIEERTKRRVSFDSSVLVIPIPKRDEYSQRIKNQIWNSAVDIYENATRNALEFSAENWDWRQVREEEDFFICIDTGEMVHPAHTNLFLEVETYSCGPSKHKESFLQMSRANAYEWQMRESQMYS